MRHLDDSRKNNKNLCFNIPLSLSKKKKKKKKKRLELFEMMMEKVCALEAMDAYVKALEEEKKKIMVFERELPLSLQLVAQAIESCRRQLEEGEQKQHVGGEELTTSEGPVLEEFIPLRLANSSSSGEESGGHGRDGKSCCNGGEGEADKKPDWLRSVQLWKEPEPPTVDVLRPIAVNAKRVGAGGAFHPFEREKNVKEAVVAAPASSTTDTNGGEEKEKESQSSQRKSRRCWSPELHRRFLHALEQLGGSHAATPKQIRELMKVDGLTNDEVKSHLQKYRLHTRRPTTGAVQSNNSSTSQTPQIVLIGGLWMPPPEYTAAPAAAAASASQPATDTTGAPSNRVYAPVASLPSELGSEQQLQQKKQLQTKRSPTGPLNSQGRCSGDDHSEDGERANSNSSATASSSQTTTSSPSVSSRQ
ncbi:myb family transcription factor EFM-like [Iris pallida]|uniref:Myb family transcription factor EFM-like n=1 Tax=Iris pallida TaxID=29817 RepID=A0AAX6DNL6_IRIPA|nr:myb family transcription factor EFM-like [Iris pallida]